MNPAVVRFGIVLLCWLASMAGAYLHGITTTEARLTAAHNKALADAEAKARASEQLSVIRFNEIEAKHLADNQRAQAAYDRLLDDYRDGAVRLRDRLSCPDVPGPAASAPSGKPAAERGLQPEDVRFLVREAKRADQVTRQLQACQALLHEDRLPFPPP